MRKLFVTTALPYANGKLHLGHLLEYVQADIWVRAQRLKGNSVQFVCADDAHGAPIMIAAEAAGMSPEDYVKTVTEGRSQYLTGFHILFDNWHTTHSPENAELAREIYLELKKRGMIFSRVIEQFFDPIKEMFLPDRYIKGECPSCHAPDQYGDSCEKCGAVYAPIDLVNPRSVLTGVKPVLRTSEHFFFRLSSPDVLQFLKKWIGDNSLQSEVAKKTAEWFEAGLSDWDVSRDAPYFGIPIPGEDSKFFYVWLDAPIGYLASLKNHFDKGQAVNHWHPASRTAQTYEEFILDSNVEQVHFIGKDIIYFHTLFWPAILHFSGLRPPTKIHVHGHLIVDGEKMSKSKGNGVDPIRYLDLGMDPDWMRYYLATKLNGKAEDVDFGVLDFTSRVNSDLIGKYVNIASRAAGFLAKGSSNQLGEIPEDAASLLLTLQGLVDAAEKMYEAHELGRCVREIMQMADRVNEYFDRNKPWELAKDAEKLGRVQSVCTVCIESFRLLTICLKPIIPELVLRAEKFLKVSPMHFADGKYFLGEGWSINTYQHLMQRVAPGSIERAFESAC